MQIGLQHYLVISTILFSLGLYGVVSRRNAVMVLIGIELILNSANLNFIAFSHFGNFGVGMVASGQIIALFVMILAAAEAAIALAIVLNIYKNFNTINVDEIDRLKE